MNQTYIEVQAPTATVKATGLQGAPRAMKVPCFCYGVHHSAYFLQHVKDYTISYLPWKIENDALGHPFCSSFYHNKCCCSNT